MRKLFYLFVFTLSLQAAADITLQKFAWNADNMVHVDFTQDGTAASVETILHDGEEASAMANTLTLHVKSYSEGFVTIVVIDSEDELGSLFVVQKVNAQYLILNKNPISGRKASMLTDLSGALDALKKTKSWGVAQSLKSLIAFFSQWPDKNLTAFYDQVELGNIRGPAATELASAPVNRQTPPAVVSESTPPQAQTQLQAARPLTPQEAYNQQLQRYYAQQRAQVLAQQRAYNQYYYGGGYYARPSQPPGYPSYPW